MPDLTDACGMCTHPFASHWVTHDRQTQGCILPLALELGGGQRAHEEPCACHAFLVPWQPDEPVRAWTAPAHTWTQSDILGPYQAQRVVPQGATPSAEDREWEPLP